MSSTVYTFLVWTRAKTKGSALVNLAAALVDHLVVEAVLERRQTLLLWAVGQGGMERRRGQEKTKGIEIPSLGGKIATGGMMVVERRETTEGETIVATSATTGDATIGMTDETTGGETMTGETETARGGRVGVAARAAIGDSSEHAASGLHFGAANRSAASSNPTCDISTNTSLQSGLVSTNLSA